MKKKKQEEIFISILIRQLLHFTHFQSDFIKRPFFANAPNKFDKPNACKRIYWIW